MFTNTFIYTTALITSTDVSLSATDVSILQINRLLLCQVSKAQT